MITVGGERVLAADRVSSRTVDDMELTAHHGFVDMCRLSPQDFTRRRKLSIPMLIVSLLVRKGRSLALEMRDLVRVFRVEGGISVPGYVKARLKLNPAAFLVLARHHAGNFYRDEQAVRLFKGHILAAVDGSTVAVPTTVETLAVYGNTSGRGRPQAMCGLSCVCDVLNRQIINLTINRGSFNERGEIPAHLNAIREVVHDHPCILIGDRGYPSLGMFHTLVESGTRFVFRVSHTHMSSKFDGMTSEDEDITIMLTTQQGKKTGLSEHRTMTLRIISIPGHPEKRIVTNLDRSHFTTDDIDHIYRARWGVETVFDIMKNKLQMGNFTGTKPILIEQDIFAVAYLVNLIFDIVQVAEHTTHDTTRPRRHTMTINTNWSIGVIKDSIIRFVLAPNKRKKKTIMDNIITEISSNLVPIRPGRSNPRYHNPRYNTYTNNKKRAF